MRRVSNYAMRGIAALVVLAVITAFALLSTVEVAAKTNLVIGMWLNFGEEVQGVEALLREYERLNPDVEVKLIYTGWDGFYQKLLTMVAGGIAPDVIVVERRWLPSFALNNIVTPIDGFLAKDKDFDVRRDLTEIKSGVFRNKVYGIPIWGGPAVLGFNVDMFDKYGVQSPLEYVHQKKWNWETFVEVGKKLTQDLNGDGKQDIYGLESISAFMPDWAAKIRQNGGDVFNEDGTKCIVNTPESIQAIQYWLDLKFRYRIVAGQFRSTGKVGMFYLWTANSLYDYNQFKDTFKLDIAPMPAGRVGYVHIAGGCPVCISSTTKHPEEAYKLAKWFALNEGPKLTRVPASRKAFPDYLKQLSHYFSEPALTLQIALSNAAPEPVVHPKASELEPRWTAVLQQAIDGKLSAEETVKRLEQVTNMILGR